MTVNDFTHGPKYATVKHHLLATSKTVASQMHIRESQRNVTVKPVEEVPSRDFTYKNITIAKSEIFELT